MMYLVVWGLLFLAPLLSLYVRTINHEDATFNWTEVLIVWRSFAIFLVLFLLHNCFLAPLIVHQQRRVLYFSVVTAVLGAFFIWQCSHKPQRDKDFRKRPPWSDMNHGRPIWMRTASISPLSTSRLTTNQSIVCVGTTCRLPSSASVTYWPWWYSF